MCVKTTKLSENTERENCISRLNFDEIINDWLTRLVSAQRGHYTASESLYTRSNYFGGVLILSTTIVTAMLFLEAKDYAKAFLVVMSVISAGLSGIVSFSRFSERAEQHRATASHYGKLRRKLESLKSKCTNMCDTDIQEKLKFIRIEWEYVSGHAPLTPKSAIPLPEAPLTQCCGDRK